VGGGLPDVGLQVGAPQSTNSTLPEVASLQTLQI